MQMLLEALERGVVNVDVKGGGEGADADVKGGGEGVVTKSIYALGALLRSNPKARQPFFQQGGVHLLTLLLSHSSLRHHPQIITKYAPQRTLKPKNPKPYYLKAKP